MPKEQKLALLDMAYPGVGARIDVGLHPGLQRFLEPHLERKPVDGCFFLRDYHHRQLIRVRVQPP
jgi:hypothetical protein